MRLTQTTATSFGRLQTDGQIESSPAVADGAVYFTAEEPTPALSTN